jgi:hypothetical protein
MPRDRARHRELLTTSVASSRFNSVCSATTPREIDEILSQQGVGRGQVGTKVLLIVKQQRKARRQKAKLEILAQEELLRRREQRRLRTIEILDPDQLPYVLPDRSQEAAPARLVRGWRRRGLRRQALFQRQRQRVRRCDGLIEAQRNTRHVHVRHGLQPIHVASQRAPQGKELRPVKPLQLGVGELKRGQRRRHIARKLQLLARELQHLLDLGQRPFVSRRCELAIKRLQRGLLRLRFGQPVFEQGELRLRFSRAFLRFLQVRARHLIGRVEIAKTLRHLGA